MLCMHPFLLRVTALFFHTYAARYPTSFIRALILLFLGKQLKKLDIQSIAGMSDAEEFADAIRRLRNLEVLELDTLPEDIFTP
eukprot:1153549-Pelagomonas_calceolata.AAC.1